MNSSIEVILNHSYAELHSKNIRQLIAFHYVGALDEDYFKSLAKFFLDKKCLTVSDAFQEAVSHNQVGSLLGDEFESILFDARDGLNPDSLGIAAGLLRGGGSLLLMLPEFERWNQFNSNFYIHVKHLLEDSSDIHYVRECYFSSEELKVDHTNNKILVNSELAPHKTLDQKKLVEQLEEAVKSNEEICCVVTSDRGRGKSSSLGFLVARLISDSDLNIIVTAPKRATADPLFTHLYSQIPEAKLSKSALQHGESNVKFFAPDRLLDEQPKADVLIVDEAAAIPIPMLEQLLDNFQIIIFSTTTHGYEGTGRGFVLKFYKLLDEKKLKWNKYKLNQPIRWSENDPLERWVNNLLFLNVKLKEGFSTPEKLNDCNIELLDREKFIQNPELLSSVFSLLIFAHYRTSPSDFKYLLDNESVRIYVLKNKGEVLGVLSINEEGGFSEELSEAIYSGDRRPKGNLLAQTLCFHAGHKRAAQLKYARIMRIAVHPEIQNNGLGSYFLKEVIDIERGNQIDVIGSSFSSNVSLLKFWETAGLSIVRLGFSRDHVSASHSAVVALGVSKQGANLVDELTTRFYRNLRMWEKGPLQAVSSEIKEYLHEKPTSNESEFTVIDRNDVESFANANRNYEACMPAIERCIALYRENIALLSLDEQKILFASVKYKNNWKNIVAEMRLNGKSDAVSSLRRALKNLLNKCLN